MRSHLTQLYMWVTSQGGSGVRARRQGPMWGGRSFLTATFSDLPHNIHITSVRGNGRPNVTRPNSSLGQQWHHCPHTSYLLIHRLIPRASQHSTTLSDLRLLTLLYHCYLMISFDLKLIQTNFEMQSMVSYILWSMDRKPWNTKVALDVNSIFVNLLASKPLPFARNPGHLRDLTCTLKTGQENFHWASVQCRNLIHSEKCN